MKNTSKKLFLILLDGPMGVGKTTTANLLHTKLKKTAHLGYDYTKPFVSNFDEISGSDPMNRNVVAAMANEYLKHGINILLEEIMSADEVEVYRKMAEKYKADFWLYQLNAPETLLHKRVKTRTKKLKKSRIPTKRIEKIRKEYLKNKYPSAHLFDSDKLSSEEIVTYILKDIKK